LPFVAGFLAAGLGADVPLGAADGGGWTCADADVTKHDRTTAKARARNMKTREEMGGQGVFN
jgi:hypothetical protein